MRSAASTLKHWLKGLLLRRGWTPPGFFDPAQPLWSMPNGLHLLRSLDVCPRTIVDLGAAEGKWSLMASEIFPDAKFVLCEPLPSRQGVLRTLVEKENGRFHCAPVIVGGSRTPLRFDVASDLDGSGVYGGTSENTLLLPQDTLDGLLSNEAFEQPYFIKFDTHGFESQIISGAEQTLKSTEAIVMECYLHRVSPTAKLFWEMCGMLSELGFRPLHISDLLARKYDSTLWQMDILFVRDDHRVFRHREYQ